MINEFELRLMSLFSLFLKGIFLWIFLCILGFYLKTKFFQKLKESKKQQVKIAHEARKATLQSPTVIDPSYEQAKTTFNCAIKNGQLSRNDILDLKGLINTTLGNNQHKYEKYCFKNDAHEIYVKLKDGTLNVLDYQTIVDFLIKRATQE